VQLKKSGLYRLLAALCSSTAFLIFTSDQHSTECEEACLCAVCSLLLSPEGEAIGYFFFLKVTKIMIYNMYYMSHLCASTQYLV